MTHSGEREGEGRLPSLSWVRALEGWWSEGTPLVWRPVLVAGHLSLTRFPAVRSDPGVQKTRKPPDREQGTSGY